MKIATFNINGINKRLPNLLAWLAATRPDVVCLQELKAEHERVSDRYDPQTRAMALSGAESAPGMAWRSSRGMSSPS